MICIITGIASTKGRKIKASKCQKDFSDNDNAFFVDDDKISLLMKKKRKKSSQKILNKIRKIWIRLTRNSKVV